MAYRWERDADGNVYAVDDGKGTPTAQQVIAEYQQSLLQPGGDNTGQNVTLWGSTPYTQQGANDPVMQAFALWNAGVPLEEARAVLGPIADQVYSNTQSHNEATANQVNRNALMAFLGVAGLGLGTNFMLGSGLAEGAAAAAPELTDAAAAGMGPASGGATTAAVGGMPAAIPEVDPTFGGILTQTGAGQFETLAPVAAGGAAASVLGPAAASAGGTAAAGGTAGGTAGLLGGLSPVGAGIGGLLAGAAGGSRPAGSTTSTTTTEIPPWVKDYVTANLDRAAAARDSLTSGPTLDARPEMQRTINGDYLDPSTNPWLKSTFDMALNNVIPGIDSIFSKGGRYGSGAQAFAREKAATDLATQIYGGNYQAERGRQATATAAAPAFDLTANQAAFYPYTAFNSLIPNVRNSASTEPFFNNPVGNALSGAVAGGILGRQLFG